MCQPKHMINKMRQVSVELIWIFFGRLLSRKQMVSSMPCTINGVEEWRRATFDAIPAFSHHLGIYLVLQHVHPAEKDAAKSSSQSLRSGMNNLDLLIEPRSMNSTTNNQWIPLSAERESGFSASILLRWKSIEYSDYYWCWLWYHNSVCVLVNSKKGMFQSRLELTYSSDTDAHFDWCEHRVHRPWCTSQSLTNEGCDRNVDMVVCICAIPYYTIIWLRLV